MLFFNQDNVTTLSNDADFYDKYVPEYDMVKWQWIRGANFTTSVSYQNETSRNSYIYALSVVDEVPSFHVFIISDIVSWVGEIKLHNITDNGHKVKPIADMLNYIDNRIFYINAYEVRGGTTYNIFYFYKISDQGLNCFKTAETGKLFVAGTKVIKLRDSLFYVIYEYKDEFSVMNLYKNKDSFYKLYKLNTHDDVTYKSGKWCGRRLILETDHANIQLFDVSDVLFPRFISYLPQAKNLIPRPKGCTHTYVCISDTHIVIPFVEKGLLNTAKPRTYLVVYDLTNPYYHTMLKYKFYLGEVEQLSSIVLTRFVGFNYLYVYADNNLYIMKGFENTMASFQLDNLPLLSSVDKVNFQLRPCNCSGAVQNIILHSVKTGIILKAYEPTVRFIVAQDEQYYRINLDDYFEGFRHTIQVLSPNKNGELPFNVLVDSTLYNLTHSITNEETFEIANIRFNYEQQKALIPISNTTYLYVDWRVFLYLRIEAGAAIVISRQVHNINGYITRVKYFPNYTVVPDPNSKGTVVVQYQINGQEEVIQFCAVNEAMIDAQCFQPFQYPLGEILNYFIYQSEDSYYPGNYFIVGSLSRGSHFSLIRFFKDIAGLGSSPDYQYIGQISASTLDSPRFCLDSLTMFDHFLIFTNHTALFIMNIDEYIDSPRWFTPKQVRIVCLQDLISEYSNGMYKEIDHVADIHIEETCQEHLSVYIFISTYGIMMIEVNKASFYSERWHYDPLKLSGSSENLTLDSHNFKPSERYLYEDGGVDYKIIADGRLLHNYYDRDLSGVLHAVNNKMMGMLIKVDFEGGYHIYMFRVLNLLTNKNSIVHFDKIYENINEWKSIFIEDEELDDGIVTFTMLCDSAILKVDVSEKTEMILNTHHHYWKNPHNKMMINITQPDAFVLEPSQILLEIEVHKEPDLVQSTPYVGGSLIILSILIVSGLMFKFYLKE